MRTLAFLLALATLLPLAAGADPEADFKAKIQPILVNYCYDCHGDGMNRGNLAFDSFSSNQALIQQRHLWLGVLKNLRAGLMPPEKKPRPTPEELAALETWIKGGVFEINPADPDPGRVTIRRLNRVEYRNTIRDLMGIDFNSEVEFPPDDTGHGFDNIADVLSLSPLLLEKYLEAAVSIVDQAVPTASKVMPGERLGGRTFRAAEGSKNGDALNFYEAAAVSRSFQARRAGTYRVSIDLETRRAYEFDSGRARVVFKIDDRQVFTRELGWEDTRIEFAHEEAWQPGSRRLTFELEPLKPLEEKRHQLDLRISTVHVQGPLEREQWTTPTNYNRFFPRGPAPETAEGRDEYARELLRSFASRAYRRPIDQRTLERLVTLAKGFYQDGGKTFEEAIGRSMVAVLASPRFLFRIDEPEPSNGGHPQIDEYSLATRLSYFLWSTMPDQELFDLAERGELRNSLAAQVKRMQADSRSQMLVRNFVGQWLQVRDVESIPINTRAVLGRRTGGGDPSEAFPSQLRRAMRTETELYFRHVMTEDRSVLEMLDSDYTFLNQRLATHYGITNVSGDDFQRVKLEEGSPRGGVLTHGSVLTVTSNPTRTSPVKRGLFVLENVLGTPPPPPPPDIPELEAARKTVQGREPTMREMIEIHRANPSCRSCHARMDPMGLAFENFNAMGMWRDKEADQEIDATGRLTTGESFSNIRELKRVLANERKTDFYRTLSEKLFTYALGRAPEHYDVHTLDQVVQRLEQNEGRFSALLQGIIESAAFQKQRDPAYKSAETLSPVEASKSVAQANSER